MVLASMPPTVSPRLLGAADVVEGLRLPGSISLHNGDGDTLARVDLGPDLPPVVSGSGLSSELDPHLGAAVSPGELRRVEFVGDDRHLYVALITDKAVLSYAFESDPLGGRTEGVVTVDPPDLAEVRPGAEQGRLLPAPLSLPEPGWSVDLGGRSQIGQDQWVADVFGFAPNRYFVEIGGDDGETNSNTLVLEQLLGWHGLIVEANPRLAATIRTKRSSTVVEAAVYSVSGRELQFVDAGPVGGLVDTLEADVHAPERLRQIAAGNTFTVTTVSGNTMLEESGAPEFIDYLSLDTEGSEVEILHSIDFTRWRVAMLTVENSGRELRRAKLTQILEPLGYVRERAWFEDWFWHPGHLAERLGLTEDEAGARVASALLRVPIFRTAQLQRRLNLASEARDHDLVKELMFEGAKPIYPNNSRFAVGGARILRREGHIADAVALLEMQESQQGILEELVATYGEERRVDDLLRTAERWLEVAPAARSNQTLRSAMLAVVPEEPEAMERLMAGNHPARARQLLLEVAEEHAASGS